ncbi:hypothetical protein FACHB389_31705 [Nostoc calcicola FACHB-389]|nr:SUMF1/EgtB/PvdO family nonheme iron enzyme [Nostoc calcicola FACHB-3891]OKH21493.1 hypothetical protein FACHB389_31705 [Nostoc calcicola FACHB-389]
MILIHLLTRQMLPGISTDCLHDIILKTWENNYQKYRENLYLDAFQQAVEEEERLLASSTSNSLILIDRTVFLELLQQNLNRLTDRQPYNTLEGDAFRYLLSNMMQTNSVLTINGNNLELGNYESIANHLVKYARNIFLAPILSDEYRFIIRCQKLVENELPRSDDAQKIAGQIPSILEALKGFVKQQEAHQILSTNQKFKWQGDSPFPGLRAFESEDALIFFGREQETKHLIKLLQENRFVAIVGASGSGKSSLVRAGIVPGIKDRYEIVYFTPGEFRNDPFLSLAAAFTNFLKAQPAMVRRNLEQILDANPTVPRELAETLENNPSKLEDLCATLLNGKDEFLLLVDQFEELFTLVKNSNLQNQFVNLLAKVQEASHFRVLITMRSEFYHNFLELSELPSELLNRGQYSLKPPSMQSLYDMILKPTQIAELKFETNLDLTIFVSASVNPGALPLMAYTLEELYKKAKERNDCRLTFDDYNAIGGVEGAIGSRAEKTFRKLSEAAQYALPKVFQELVVVKKLGVATRKRVLLEKVKSSSGAEELVDALIEARLLLTDSEPVSNKPIVEVAHEALFSSWKKLKEWIEETVGYLFVLQQIEEAIELWKTYREDEKYLWKGDRLKDAQTIVRRLSLELRPDQEEFLQPEVDRLEAKLLDDTLTHIKRESIGEELHHIGDTRPGVGVRNYGLPDIKWCKVPSGFVQLEKEEGEFKVDYFYIAKYVVTYKQFQTFVDHPNGYECSQWWKNLAPQKFQLSMQPFRYDNYPRTNVNWFEAMAFCGWLTENLPCDVFPKAEGTDWVVRLPTEWEWQQAASGGDTQRDYPWGNWCEKEIRCNDTQSGLERPTAVGMYPQGISPVDALDMIGNVSEWCLNSYEVPRQIDLTSYERRSIRGGAWRFRAQSQNLKYRDFANSANPAKHIGFRVVYAPRVNVSC